MVDPGKVNVALQRPGPVTPQERRYDWAVSALALNARAAAAQALPNGRYVFGLAERPAPGSSGAADGSFSQRLAFSLDFWWLYLFYLGVLPAWLALLVPAVLVGTAAGLMRSAYRDEAGV